MTPYASRPSPLLFLVASGFQPSGLGWQPGQESPSHNLIYVYIFYLCVSNPFMCWYVCVVIVIVLSCFAMLGTVANIKI